MIRSLLAAVVLLGAVDAAWAQEVPKGRFALVAGGRENMGELGEDFQRGWVYGVEAGYQPGRLGVAWSLSWGRFDSEEPTLVENELRVLEMQFGLRLRWPLGSRDPRFLVTTGGLTLARSNIPIPPSDPPERSYYGPYAGLGLEQLLAGKYLFALEARYGMLFNGPAGLTLVMSLAFGT